MKRVAYAGVTAFFGLCALLWVGLGFHVRAHARRLEQPIHFPHATHINKVGLECTTCHQAADRSPQAGAPPLSVCMGCHESVKTESPEIRNLTAHWQNREPVEWNKIHVLPWHVRFTHKRHIKAGVDCAVCHGEVKTMMQVHQVRSLQMGWCVRCHRQNEAPTDCWACHK